MAWIITRWTLKAEFSLKFTLYLQANNDVNAVHKLNEAARNSGQQISIICSDPDSISSLQAAAKHALKEMDKHGNSSDP
jgi:hypothetical protein